MIEDASNESRAKSSYAGVRYIQTNNKNRNDENAYLDFKTPDHNY